MNALKILLILIIVHFSSSTVCQTVWTSSNSGLPPGFAINDFETVGTEIYAGGSFFNGSNFEARLYRSSNNGTSWTQITTTGLTSLFTGNALAFHKNKILISGSISNLTQNYSVFVSTNNGQSWTASNAGLPPGFVINDFETVGTEIYAGGSFFTGSNFEARLYKSSNDGASWTQIITTGLASLITGNALAFHNNRFLISGSISNLTQNYSVFVSTTPVSVNTIPYVTHYKLFPNPFINEIHLQGLLSEKIEIQIIDILGNHVKSFSKTISEDNLTLDLSELNSGVYVLIIHSENKKYASRKIIK